MTIKNLASVVGFRYNNARMRLAYSIVPLLGACMLVSCHLFNKKGDNTPEYMRESSALDGPGAEAARAALRDKLVKDGSFAVGDTLDVQQGKVYLFNRNPDNDTTARGQMVESATAKIISCEGLYYYVELEDGDKGYLRESDLVNPVKLVSTNDSLMPDGGVTPGPDGWGDGVQQPDVVELDSNQKLMTNDAGRTVVVVNKKSDRTDEFEARKKAMENGQAAPIPEPSSAELPTPAADVPLPEPAGSAE